MKSSEPQVQVHPLRGGLTTQQITSRDPAFNKLRTESREISFRQICPEVPNTTYLTHGIHPYPAKFIPQIPRHFIKTQTEPGDVVLDPFAGSGTALVESALLSRHSIGADINPLSPILWDVKTNFSDEVSAWGFELSDFFRVLKRTQPGDPPPIPSIQKWFDPGPVRDLTRIFDATRDFPFTSEHLRRFVLVCASSTVRRVSRADPKVSKPFVSRRERELFAKGEVDWRTIDVFTRQVEKYSARVGAFHRACKEEVARTGITPRVTAIFPQDARALPDVPDRSVDAAVTSPPYVNAQEYFCTVKLELFWLGLADQRGVVDLDKQVLGTEKVASEGGPEFVESKVTPLAHGLRKIYGSTPGGGWLQNDTSMASGTTFAEWLSSAVGGKYGFLVGDNTIRRVPLPVHLGILQIAQEEGFQCIDKVYDRIVARSLTPNRNNSAGFIDVEWFLTLELN